MNRWPRLYLIVSRKSCKKGEMSGSKEQRAPILDGDDKVSVSPSANSDATVIVDKGRYRHVWHV